MITDGVYQSMFMTYEDGVVVVDAPPSYASRIRSAIAEVTDKPVTHLVYSHFHADHIGGAKTVGGAPAIIAQAETNRLLARDDDPNRPLATSPSTMSTSYRSAARRSSYRTTTPRTRPGTSSSTRPSNEP
jgi:glyoxylase-like metal-dependent hydrolase (beta-lactamase superfamily II)